MKSAAGSLQKLTMSFMKSKKGAVVIIAIGILGILITAFSGKSGSKTGYKSYHPKTALIPRYIYPSLKAT